MELNKLNELDEIQRSLVRNYIAQKITITYDHFIQIEKIEKKVQEKEKILDLEKHYIETNYQLDKLFYDKLQSDEAFSVFKPRPHTAWVEEDKLKISSYNFNVAMNSWSRRTGKRVAVALIPYYKIAHQHYINTLKAHNVRESRLTHSPHSEHANSPGYAPGLARGQGRGLGRGRGNLPIKPHVYVAPVKPPERWTDKVARIRREERKGQDWINASVEANVTGFWPNGKPFTGVWPAEKDGLVNLWPRQVFSPEMLADFWNSALKEAEKTGFWQNKKPYKNKWPKEYSYYKLWPHEILTDEQIRFHQERARRNVPQQQQQPRQPQQPRQSPRQPRPRTPEAIAEDFSDIKTCPGYFYLQKHKGQPPCWDNQMKKIFASDKNIGCPKQADEWIKKYDIMKGEGKFKIPCNDIEIVRQERDEYRRLQAERIKAEKARKEKEFRES